jgi:serine/threonine protein kinase
MEFVELGPVMKYDRETNKFTSTVTGGLCEERLAGQYLLDIASGLGYLHLHHIAHRDLKPDNVLLGKLGRCKIADFGVAHYFEEDHANDKTLSVRSLERSHSRAQIRDTQGTYCFWAPEMIQGDKKFNAYSCDMWAAGVCYFIFVTGKLPFYAESPVEMFDFIAQASPVIPNTLSNHSRRVIFGLLATNIDTRLTVQDLQSDPWLKSTELHSTANGPDNLHLSAGDIHHAFPTMTVKQRMSVCLSGARNSIASTLSQASEAFHQIRRRSYTFQGSQTGLNE